MYAKKEIKFLKMFENTHKRRKSMMKYYTNCRYQGIHEIILRPEVNSPNPVC